MTSRASSCVRSETPRPASIVHTPYVTIDLAKIEHNAGVIVDLCKRHGIAVTGVTKGVCGHPDVARAMLRGGVISIAESRIDNVKRLRDAGIETSIMLLRLPALSKVTQVVAGVDISLNSELSVLEALGAACANHGKCHDVIVMVDLGDLREGLWPDELVAFVGKVIELDGIRIVGLGTNLACFTGLAPTKENMNQLVQLASKLESRYGLSLRWVSGINSGSLELIASGGMPARVNHARMGEAILLGRETLRRKPWPGLFQDAFVLYAEVLELKEKPSSFAGERGEDAFGRHPEFEDLGRLQRALVNIGREDVLVEGLTPLTPQIRILGGSSGYLVVDVTAAPKHVQVGDELAFDLSYGALLAAMTSKYVEKRILNPCSMTSEI